MVSPQKCQILDPSPSPYVTRETVTNIFLDQGPSKIILHVLYN